MQRKTIAIIDNQGGYTESDEEELAEELKQKGHPTRLDALDGSEHLLPRHISNGVNFLVAYNETHDQDFMTMACDCASFPALQEHSELTRDAIKQASETGDDMQDLVDTLKAECLRLGNLYRCIGFAHGARIYLELANELSHSDQEGMLALAGYFKDEAIRKFYCATILEADPVSIELTGLILKGKTLEEAKWLTDQEKEWLFKGVGHTKQDLLHHQAEEEIAELRRLGSTPNK